MKPWEPNKPGRTWTVELTDPEGAVRTFVGVPDAAMDGVYIAETWDLKLLVLAAFGALEIVKGKEV